MLKLNITKKVNGETRVTEYESVLAYCKDTLESKKSATMIAFPFPDYKKGVAKTPTYVQTGMDFVKTQNVYNLAILSKISDLVISDCESRCTTVLRRVTGEKHIVFSPENVKNAMGIEGLDDETKNLLNNYLNVYYDYTNVSAFFSTELALAISEKGENPELAKAILDSAIVKTMAYIRMENYSFIDASDIITHADSLIKNQQEFDREEKSEEDYMKENRDSFTDMKTTLDKLLQEHFKIPVELDMFFIPGKVRSNVKTTNELVSEIKSKYYLGRKQTVSGMVERTYDEKGRAVAKEFALFGLDKFQELYKRKAGETAETVNQADGVKVTETKDDAEKESAEKPAPKTTKKPRTKKADTEKVA